MNESRDVTNTGKLVIEEHFCDILPGGINYFGRHLYTGMWKTCL